MPDDCREEFSFFDPDDQDRNETIKYARKKLKRPVAAAMPSKKNARTSNTKVAADVLASQKVPKTIHGCIVESCEPQGNEWNLLYLQISKITLQAKVLLR